MIGPLIWALLLITGKSITPSHFCRSESSTLLLGLIFAHNRCSSILLFLLLKWFLKHPLLCHGHHSNPRSVKAAEPTAEAALPTTSVIITHSYQTSGILVLGWQLKSLSWTIRPSKFWFLSLPPASSRKFSILLPNIPPPASWLPWGLCAPHFLCLESHLCRLCLSTSYSPFIIQLQYDFLMSDPSMLTIKSLALGTVLGKGVAQYTCWSNMWLFCVECLGRGRRTHRIYSIWKISSSDDWSTIGKKVRRCLQLWRWWLGLS